MILLNELRTKVRYHHPFLTFWQSLCFQRIPFEMVPVRSHHACGITHVCQISVVFLPAALRRGCVAATQMASDRRGRLQHRWRQGGTLLCLPLPFTMSQSETCCRERRGSNPISARTIVFCAKWRAGFFLGLRIGFVHVAKQALRL